MSDTPNRQPDAEPPQHDAETCACCDPVPRYPCIHCRDCRCPETHYQDHAEIERLQERIAELEREIEKIKDDLLHEGFERDVDLNALLCFTVSLAIKVPDAFSRSSLYALIRAEIELLRVLLADVQSCRGPMGYRTLCVQCSDRIAVLLAKEPKC